MKTIILVLICLIFVGCGHLKKGEYIDVQNRVLGVDASLPVPTAEAVNIFNVKIGWVETTYSHGYGTTKKSKAIHSIIYLGTAERECYLGISE